MCHCGDLYCDLRQDARIWANAYHDRLVKSDDEVQLCPNAVAREIHIVSIVRSKVKEKFGSDVMDFRWDRKENL